MNASSDPPPAEETHDPTAVDLGRIAWLAVVLTLVAGLLVLALKRDWGYAIVTAAVAISAAINLF